jgi:hypothetical protein
MIICPHANQIVNVASLLLNVRSCALETQCQLSIL